MNCSVRERDGKRYAVTVHASVSEPVWVCMWYQITATESTGFDRPDVGDQLTHLNTHGAQFLATRNDRRTGYVHTERVACDTTYEPLPCPKVKAGVQTRYNGFAGYWEKLLRKGWVRA